MTDEERRSTSPGPWRACGHERGLCKCGQVWSPGNDMPVATVFREDDEVGELPEATWKANMRLIEEAPTVRDQLAEAVKLLEQWDDKYRDDYTFSQDTRAFLAKVRP